MVHAHKIKEIINIWIYGSTFCRVVVNCKDLQSRWISLSQFTLRKSSAFSSSWPESSGKGALYIQHDSRDWWDEQDRRRFGGLALTAGVSSCVSVLVDCPTLKVAYNWRQNSVSREHRHSLSTYSLHSMITVSAEAWHAVLYLITPWQYPAEVWHPILNLITLWQDPAEAWHSIRNL